MELFNYTFLRSDVGDFYINAVFHFKYFGFGWLPSLTGIGMQVFIVALICCFLMLAVGLFYRLFSLLCCLGFSYLFLLERSFFLNHWYLIALLSFLLVLMPANTALSLDCWRKPSLRKDRVSIIYLYILLAQIALVYFYSGIAKINGDWLAGEPLRSLLQAQDSPLRALFLGGPLEGWINLLSLFVILLELALAFLLMWKSSRFVAIGLAVAFNALNALLFPVGVFPYLMMVCTCLFLALDKRLLRRFSLNHESGQVIFPGRAVKAILLIYMVIQVLLPLRAHFFALGADRLWAEKGLLFSWHMMTKSKGGEIQYWIESATEKEMQRLMADDFDLTWGQSRKLFRQPDLIWQYGRHLGRKAEAQGRQEVAVYVDAFLHLNGREQQRFVHPHVNLMQLEPSLAKSYWWVIPLEENLGNR